MWFWHRSSKLIPLVAPVRGKHLAVPQAPEQSTEILLKIQPSDYVLHAPLDGDVTATSSTSIELIGWDQQVYQLLLTSSTGHCDWQVRVGDHVTPVGILGTLSSDTAATAILTCSRHRPTSDAPNADYLPTLGY